MVTEMLQQAHLRVTTELRSIRFSFRLIRRLVLALLLLACIIVLIVIGVKHHLRLKQALREGDYPHYDNRRTKLSNKIVSLSADSPFHIGCREPDTGAPRADAAFVMLARNSELDDVVSSMRSMERHFNQWFKYPWVFLNDVEFDDDFKQTVKRHTTAEVEFGVVPKEQWEFPDSIDRDEMYELLQGQGDRRIMYGQMESYHKMCRFYSGHFFSHPLVTKRKWYWRVEPDVQFFCDLTYDPFIEMENRNKKYGFTVSIQELYYTVPSLFKETKAFIKERGIEVGTAWDILVKKYLRFEGADAERYRYVEQKEDVLPEVRKNLFLKRFLDFKGKTDGQLKKVKEMRNMRNIFDEMYDKPNLYEDRYEDEEYNLCHFWTNFEIARTDIFTSETYQAYFRHLDERGGFYKERWGDAPVHSLAVGMLLSKEEIHYFRDIGYKHTTLGHCPNNAPDAQLPYHPSDDFVEEIKPWYQTFMSQPDKPVRNGVGCRCSCPFKHRELEDKNSECIRHFAKVMSDNYEEESPVQIDPIEVKLNRAIDRRLRKGGKLEDMLA